MPDQVYIGKFRKGLTEYYQSFNNDNDSWSTLFNAYCWRGQILRKRGTSFLGQLQIQVVLVAIPTNNWQTTAPSLSSGSINLKSALGLGNSTIAPGSISLTVGANTYTDPIPRTGTLTGTPGGSATINYATGVFTVSGGGSSTVTGNFSYFPGNPVMGIRDFVNSVTNAAYPVQLAFDTLRSYQLNQSVSPKQYFNTTYYKGTNTPFVWSGQNYQQFYTTNYQGALWATNNKPGFNFLNGTYVAGTGTTTVTFNFKSGGVNFTTLIVGDKLWFNEWTSSTNLNTLLGTVSDVTGAAAGNYVITFASGQAAAGTGIVQVLTNTIPGQDGIKWYDGDPTANTGLPTGNNLGWINFSPPLTANQVSILDLPQATYYLVGALIIEPFKDRLVFFSPYVQTSTGNVIQLIDTALWSWNGTPYYNSVTPVNQNFDVTAYYVDETGKGGYLSAGIDQPISTVGNNQDVLLVGFGGNGRKTRFVSTGDDLQPFLFFLINSEMPSTSTFSSVVMDKGTIDMGTYGICLTDQQGTQRIDLDIPQEVFEVDQANNGVQRVSGIRDFYREWIYFSYPNALSPWVFNSNTFLYNYREGTWSILYENFTAHGRFRSQGLFTWATVPFATWADWNEPWNAGISDTLIPEICAGNPQGYILVLDQGTGEGVSGTILALSSAFGGTQIQSINHCVNVGDYVQLENILGPTGYNGTVGRVFKIVDINNFVIDLPFISTTYLGLGQYIKMIQPLIITKQFNFYWDKGRKTRLGVQQYLFDATAKGQVTINIYLSMDASTIYNMGPIFPDPETTNSSLIYSQTVYTCPESTNLGLTPSNVNLQMPTALTQQQIWHRKNTSLIGDTVQLGITLSDAQMRNTSIAYDEIGLHAINLTIYPSQLLS